MPPSDLPAVPLLCPRCRVRGSGAHAVPLRRSGAVWLCPDPGCAARFPAEPFTALLRDASPIAGAIATVSWHRMAPDAAVAWLESLPADAPAQTAARRMATYLWAHFRDRMPASFTPSFVTEPLLPVVLAQLAKIEGGTVLVMGTGAGRLPLELAAAGAGVVVALDLDPMFVGWASEMAQQAEWFVPMPQGAERWTTALLQLPDRLLQASGRVIPICADALQPPLPHRFFDVVVLPNLLDNIADPLGLLAEAQALLAPSGRLVISTPFAWQRGITPQAARLEARDWLTDTGQARRLDAPDVLKGILTGQWKSSLPCKMRLEHASEVTWHLRIHARQFNTFVCHVYVLQKADAQESTRGRDASCSS
jgi:SAM-dependent methyltransferase